MTVEQLEIIITANSDDLDKKLSAAASQIEEIERSAASVGNAYEIPGIIPSLTENVLEANGAEKEAEAAAEYGILKSAEEKVLNEKKQVEKENFDLPSALLEYMKQPPVLTEYVNQPAVRDFFNIQGSGIAAGSSDLLINSSTQSYAAERRTEQTTVEEIIPGNYHVTIELDGDLLAETVLKSNAKRIIRSNGMAE